VDSYGSAVNQAGDVEALAPGFADGNRRGRARGGESEVDTDDDPVRLDTCFVFSVFWTNVHELVDI
jgi:hypothetical protein